MLSISDAAAKWLVATHSLGQVVALRAGAVLILIVCVAWRHSGLASLYVRDTKAQAVRAVLAAISTLAFIQGLRFLPLADAVAAAFIGPLFITALAGPLLGEQVSWRRWLAVLAGFAGVLLILRPSGDYARLAVLLPVVAALCGALRDLWTRRIRPTESALSILLCANVAVLLVGLTINGTQWSGFSVQESAILLMSGVLIGGAHLLHIQAFRIAPAGLIAPFKYTGMIWAIVLGVLIWGDFPDVTVLMGAALIIGAGGYVLHREKVVQEKATHKP